MVKQRSDFDFLLDTCVFPFICETYEVLVHVVLYTDTLPLPYRPMRSKHLLYV